LSSIRLGQLNTSPSLLKSPLKMSPKKWRRRPQPPTRRAHTDLPRPQPTLKKSQPPTGALRTQRKTMTLLRIERTRALTSEKRRLPIPSSRQAEREGTTTTLARSASESTGLSEMAITSLEAEAVAEAAAREAEESVAEAAVREAEEAGEALFLTGSDSR
jgi:hypothetical protein